MPSAKNGTACTLTTPKAPTDAVEAADDKPGDVDQPKPAPPPAS